MEHYKIPKFLNDAIVSKFVTEKWVEGNYLSSGHYFINKNIRFKNSQLRSDLCDYSDTYIVLKRIIYIRATANTDTEQNNVAFKTNAPVRSCITRIESTLMKVYNLLEHNQNYSMTSEILWNYYRDETDGVDDNTSTGKSFKYVSKIAGKTEARPALPD